VAAKAYNSIEYNKIKDIIIIIYNNKIGNKIAIESKYHDPSFDEYSILLLSITIE